MSETIQQKLDRLADLQAQIDLINIRYAEQRDAILTPEIQRKLDQLEAEQDLALTAASVGVRSLTEEIKADVLAAGQSVTGAHLQAVWVKGRVSWDTRRLDGYAAAHPEIAVFRKISEPTVSIRSR
jgi:hypothetical protein